MGEYIMIYITAEEKKGITIGKFVLDL